LLEATGICSGAWFLGIIHKKISGFQLDEVYIGTPEERAAMNKGDLSSEKGDSVAEAHIGTNVLHYAPGANSIPAEWKSQKFHMVKSFSERRADILANVKDIREQIGQCSTKEEREAFESALALETASLKELNEEQQIVETNEDLVMVEQP
jgi:hypothetical protein